MSLTLPTGLNMVNVARDYLKQLHGHIMTTLLRQFGDEVWKSAHFDFALTVPAIWSDAAKERTRRAANAAGLGADTSLELLSEPESAAVFTLKTINNYPYRASKGDKVLVCDAGGGTVDLVSYEVKQVEPVLKLQECTTGAGDFCGASFIDRALEKLLQIRMGSAYDSMSLMHKQQIAENFETSKMAFRDDPSKPTFYVNVPTIANLLNAGVVDHQFEISRDEMRSLFDPVVKKILELVQEQVQLASDGTNKVTAILLVGWFGESEYLYIRIRAWASPMGIQVLQPRDAATAVVQGAVLKVLEARTGKAIQLARRARWSYGIPTKEVFVEGRHVEIDAERDRNTGMKIAQNQVRWFIRAVGPSSLYH